MHDPIDVQIPMARILDTRTGKYLSWRDVREHCWIDGSKAAVQLPKAQALRILDGFHEDLQPHLKLEEI